MLECQVIKIELKHRYPESATPLETTNLARCQGSAQAGHIAHFQIFQHHGKFIAPHNATCDPEGSQQCSHARAVGDTTYQVNYFAINTAVARTSGGILHAHRLRQRI